MMDDVRNNFSSQLRKQTKKGQDPVIYVSYGGKVYIDMYFFKIFGERKVNSVTEKQKC